MSLDADVGAGIELGGFSLKALLDIGATLDGMHATLKKVHRLEEAYEFGAVQVRLNGTATSDSGSDTIEMGLGGPTYGRMWQLRSLAVGGVQWTTTVAGSALVVVSSARNLTPALPDIVDVAGSLPAVSQYGTSQIVIRHPNHLRVVILTPTASTQYAAGGYATDLPDKRERIETSL
jgi:hypothetical protein